MKASEILNRSFMENRSRLIEIAGFLDRLDSTADAQQARDDFRWVMFQKGVAELLVSESGRSERILKLLSRDTLELKVGL